MRIKCLLMPSFNQPLDNWNFSKALTMCGIFRGATAFNQPLDSWSIPIDTDVSEMFDGATSFNQPLDSWTANLKSKIF